MTKTVAKALEAEANSTDVTFTFREIEFSVPPMEEWEHDALVAIENNRIATLIESVIPADQLAKFKATKPKVKDTIALAEAMLSAGGTDSGKSEG
jgi:hypothetical protein